MVRCYLMFNIDDQVLFIIYEYSLLYLQVN